MWHMRQDGIVECVPPDYARVSIIFDLHADPVTGVVCDDAGPDAPFAGWMELTRAIERAIDAARRGDADGHC
jgi:hypothetical protein